MARKRKNAYRDGYIRPTRYKTFCAEVYFDGVKHRKSCKDETDAKRYIDNLMIAKSGGFKPLTESEMRMAREAMNMLPPDISIVEAVRQWCRDNGCTFSPVLASEAFDTMLAEKESLGLRPRSLSSLKDHVKPFLADFAGAKVHEVTTVQIRDWLTGKGYRGSTWNNYRRDIHNFFGWCVTEKHINRNPCSDVPKARTPRAVPECFSVHQAEAFLSALIQLDPELVPYYATGFFAGIRSAELDRLDASCFGPGVITIGPNQAKIGQQRHVTILPNLRAWLDAYPPTGRLFQRNHKKRYTAVLKALNESPQTNGFAWVDNGMRHSFASYHIAAFEDSAKTAVELGHHDASLLYSTYRSLTTKAEGEQYFDITPKNVASFWQGKKKGQ